ncbi:MAG TPA: hypothetical protein VG939_01180, partial [Caulobacteraceae bacterium]|nr:hypothetical protein [Caulobacteraceae bacterium]
MQPKSAETDPFDLDFEADDEFATPLRNPEDDWRETPLDRPSSATPHPDPFVGLSGGGTGAGDRSGAGWQDDPLDDTPSTPHADPFVGLAAAPPEPAADPFADLPP